MVKPLLIGITGGIGTGKSLVCKIFNSLGVPVYDADSRAKALMATLPILIEELKREFGIEAYLEDGSINRNYIAQSVFGNPQRLEKLNRLVHPRVGEDFRHWVDQHAGATYLLKEAALLFESGSSAELDGVILVTAPENLRIRRVIQRDSHRTEEDVRRIISSQWPEEDKMKLARYFIENDESQLVIPQVLRLHEGFRKTG